LQPREEATAPQVLPGLLQELRQLPEVEVAQFDLHWLERLHAITDTARHAAWILAALLGLAVLLVVGNTIRLEIQHRRSEIEILLLVGATEELVRRPFLYGGLWYGLAGSLLGWLLLAVALWLLGAPVERLATLYHSDFTLGGVTLGDLIGLLLGGGILGVVGAWLAVARHLALVDAEP
jgi:cell division transport system permease protein